MALRSRASLKRKLQPGTYSAHGEHRHEKRSRTVNVAARNLARHDHLAEIQPTGLSDQDLQQYQQAYSTATSIAPVLGSVDDDVDSDIYTGEHSVELALASTSSGSRSRLNVTTDVPVSSSDSLTPFSAIIVANATTNSDSAAAFNRRAAAHLPHGAGPLEPALHHHQSYKRHDQRATSGVLAKWHIHYKRVQPTPAQLQMDQLIYPSTESISAANHKHVWVTKIRVLPEHTYPSLEISSSDDPNAKISVYRDYVDAMSLLGDSTALVAVDNAENRRRMKAAFNYVVNKLEPNHNEELQMQWELGVNETLMVPFLVVQHMLQWGWPVVFENENFRKLWICVCQHALLWENRSCPESSSGKYSAQSLPVSSTLNQGSSNSQSNVPAMIEPSSSAPHRKQGGSVPWNSLEKIFEICRRFFDTYDGDYETASIDDMRKHIFHLYPDLAKKKSSTTQHLCADLAIEIIWDTLCVHPHWSTTAEMAAWLLLQPGLPDLMDGPPLKKWILDKVQVLEKVLKGNDLSRRLYNIVTAMRKARTSEESGSETSAASSAPVSHWDKKLVANWLCHHPNLPERFDALPRSEAMTWIFERLEELATRLPGAPSGEVNLRVFANKVDTRIRVYIALHRGKALMDFMPLAFSDDLYTDQDTKTFITTAEIGTLMLVSLESVDHSLLEDPAMAIARDDTRAQSTNSLDNDVDISQLYPPLNRYEKLLTSTDRLRCGLHALALSFKCQAPNIRTPTWEDLQLIRQTPDVQIVDGDPTQDEIWADALGVIASVWAKQQKAHIGLGIFMDGREPSFYGDAHQPERTIWIHCDNAVELGLAEYNQYSGLKRRG